MKKLIILSVSILLSAPMVFGQSDKKDYSDLFPEAGDYSLGLDMSNIIRFVGNSFSSNGNSNFPNYGMIEPTMTATTINNTIYGRYFLTDQTATRFRVGVGVNNVTSRQYVYDDVANIDNPLNDDPMTYEKTVDEYKSRNSQIELGIGYEYRKNLWRMQGYAGGEVFGAYIHRSSTYTYGNAMSEVNQSPTTYNFGENGDGGSDSSVRLLETSGGDIFRYGVGLYTGADFFITRSISIGVEYNLFVFGSYATEESGISETYKLDQVYTGETKITPSNTALQSMQQGTLNLSVYF